MCSIGICLNSCGFGLAVELRQMIKTTGNWANNLTAASNVVTKIEWYHEKSGSRMHQSEETRREVTQCLPGSIIGCVRHLSILTLTANSEEIGQIKKGKHGSGSASLLFRATISLAKPWRWTRESQYISEELKSEVDK